MPLKTWLEPLKLERVLIPFASFFVGVLFAKGTITWSLLMPLSSIAFIYGASAALNDIFDYKIDILSNPTRPLPSKKVNFIGLYMLVLLALIIGMTSSFFTGIYFNKIYFISLGLAAFCIGIIYAVWGSKHFISGCGMLGITHGFLSSIAGIYLFAPIDVRSIGFAIAIAILLFFGYNIKDFKDAEADRAYRLTLPTIFGTKVARKIVATFLCFPLPAAFIINLSLGLTTLALILSVIFSLGLILLALALLRISNTENYARILKYFRILMAAYILSLAL